MLTIVIPVGPKDQSDLELLTQNIIKMGPVGAHRILLVSVPSRLHDAEEAKMKLHPVCGNVDVVDTGNEFDNPWPIGPDRMWHWTVTHLDKMGNTKAWLWLECDSCLLESEWAGQLEEAYIAAGKPFFGHVLPTKWKKADGTFFTAEGDFSLRGVAIYPPLLSRNVEMSPLFNNMSYAMHPQHPREPWDIYLRWQFHRLGVASTPLIYDRWQTCNYVRDMLGSLVGEPCPDKPTAEAGSIPASAILVHGCKDGSLQRLVLGMEAPKKAAKVVEHEITIPESRPVEVPELSSWAEIKGAMKAVRAVAGLEQESTYETPIEEVVLNDTDKTVLAAILELERPRIGMLVAKTGVGKADLLSVLPKIGYRMKEAGWIEKLEEN
jgi:hypothetical protein